MRAVTVGIPASDPGTREGAIALLSAHPDIVVLTTAALVPAPRAGHATASEAGR